MLEVLLPVLKTKRTIFDLICYKKYIIEILGLIKIIELCCCWFYFYVHEISPISANFEQFWNIDWQCNIDLHHFDINILIVENKPG